MQTKTSDPSDAVLTHLRTTSTKKDDGLPVLFVFDNPASNSIAASMFSAFKDNRNPISASFPIAY